MLFDEQFVASIKDDPVSKTVEICEMAIRATDGDRDWNASDREALMEAYALLAEMEEGGIFPLKVQFPNAITLSSLAPDSLSEVLRWLQAVLVSCTAEAAKLRLHALRNRFHAGLGLAFSYEFSQGDLSRVQELINSLRDLIPATPQLEREHQQRLLRRLERLQSEMHKKVSDLDRFWGLVGDAGVVLGKLGQDAKPIVDRIREIADIVWRTQSRAEELPSGTQLPSLGHDARADVR